MTYLNCILLFKTSLLAVNPDGTFVRGRRPDASLASTTANWPMVALMPFRETHDRKLGNIERQIVMFFVSQDSTNNTTDERDVIVEQMNALSESFLADFENRIKGKASITSKILKTPELQTFPGYCTGYSVSFTLTSKKPVC
jgi:hypothetical protein